MTTPDPLDAAIREAMKEAGCEEAHGLFGTGRFCDVHDEPWDTDRDVCSVIDQAVRIGYSAGRRDALSEAEREVVKNLSVIWPPHRHPDVREAIDAAQVVIQQLMPTTEETDDATTE